MGSGILGFNLLAIPRGCGLDLSLRFEVSGSGIRVRGSGVAGVVRMAMWDLKVTGFENLSPRFRVRV